LKEEKTQCHDVVHKVAVEAAALLVVGAAAAALLVAAPGLVPDQEDDKLLKVYTIPCLVTPW